MITILVGFNTHKRLDRDSYVDIKWDNIEPSYMHNFEFCSGNWNCDTWGYSYDCDSIMHYPKDQMSKNDKDTISNKYSKVPIIRTGPIIRTVLIFFRYFTIISTVPSQKMWIVLFIFITALPFLLYILF